LAVYEFLILFAQLVFAIFPVDPGHFLMPLPKLRCSIVGENR